MSINLDELTVEDFQKLKQKMDEAENDTTPFAVVQNDELHVVGDPNITETKKHEYTLKMAYPNTEKWREAIEEAENYKIFNETENYIGVERKFSDVWVTPRVQTAVMSSFVALYRFFNVTLEDGSVRDLSAEEAEQALRLMNQEMTDAMCHAVATVLKIDEIEEEFMIPTPTATVLIQMIVDFPELINGMDFFTDK